MRAVIGHEHPLLLRREGPPLDPWETLSFLPLQGPWRVSPQLDPSPSELERTGFQPHSRAPCGGGHAVPVLRVYDALDSEWSLGCSASCSDPTLGAHVSLNSCWHRLRDITMQPGMHIVLSWPFSLGVLQEQ